ncbi:MAG: hypothetical protein DRR08_12665 [Candidatus Parabeggiatoa sp. nov. 2]|nr:MAG: hypothetical protein B6247_08815 [Beggiatoa sp. 4572_84]RKZ59896.1 MAG: hypothetical protein DRR08_12665 [Gammaproteobacteria bacterium]
MKNTAKFISAAGLSCMMAGTAWADLNTGLVAHYPFNGNAQDVSGNKNHGIVKGPTLTQDRFKNADSAYNFEGANHSIVVPSSSSLNPANQLSIAFWIKINGITNDWSPIIYKGGSALLGGASNREYTVWLHRQPYLALASAGNKSAQHVLNSKPITKGKWLFYTAVVDRRNHSMKVYLNGVLNTQSGDSYSSFNNNNHELVFGGRGEGHSSYSPPKAVLDDIRLYNRALSADEVKQLYTETGIKPPCQLDVAAKLQEKQLEPEDDAIYRITATQTASCCTAKSVVAKVTLTGKHEGIALKPDSLKFGTIKPKQSVHKDLRVATKKAKPGKGASFSMAFDYECVYLERGKDHKEFVIEVAED